MDGTSQPSGPRHGAAWDQPPARPTRSYLVCSVPRSGSGLLCRALWRTGVAGAPMEYFNPVHMEPLRGRLGADAPAAYQAALVRVRTTPNGVFGFKAHFNHFRQHVLEPGLLDAFPALRFVHIAREDKLRQAISFVRAQQTGQWSSKHPVARAPTYDARRIDAALAKFEREERAWEAFFRERDVEPLRLRYEELATDYEGTILDLLEWIGLGRDHIVPSPPIARQRDLLTERWRRRYLRSHRPSLPATR